MGRRESSRRRISAEVRRLGEATRLTLSGGDGRRLLRSSSRALVSSFESRLEAVDEDTSSQRSRYRLRAIDVRSSRSLAAVSAAARADVGAGAPSAIPLDIEELG